MTEVINECSERKQPWTGASWILDGLEHLRVRTCNSAVRKAAEGPESRGRPAESAKGSLTPRWASAAGGLSRLTSLNLAGTGSSLPRPTMLTSAWVTTKPDVGPLPGPAYGSTLCWALLNPPPDGAHAPLHSLPQHRWSRSEGKDVQHEGQELWLLLRVP